MAPGWPRTLHRGSAVHVRRARLTSVPPQDAEPDREVRALASICLSIDLEAFTVVVPGAFSSETAG